MECREQKETGPITATSFDYEEDSFVVKTKCGRLDNT